MGVAISLVVTIMEILNGFLDTDKEKIKMAQTFNCSKIQLLTKIIIPANISTFINSLKINIGLSLVGVITGEFLVSKAGLRIFNSLWRPSFSTRFSNDRSNNLGMFSNSTIWISSFTRKTTIKNP